MLGFLGYPKKKQTLSIFCTKCNNDLCLDDSFISDTYDKNDDNHVKYKCQKCGQNADFNFDIAPVPINWNELKVRRDNDR
jgi:RNase P subunit RPR2